MLPSHSKPESTSPKQGSSLHPTLACMMLGAVSFPGLSQYSSDPHTEWELSTYSTRDQVLEALRNLRYKGGNTFTGNSISHDLAAEGETLPMEPPPWRSRPLGTERRVKVVGEAVALHPSVLLPRSGTDPRPGEEPETRCWCPAGG